MRDFYAQFPAGDIRVDTYTSGVGLGCTVRVTHIPTGHVASAEGMMSQARAQEEALGALWRLLGYGVGMTDTQEAPVPLVPATLGRVVHYRLNGSDVNRITQARDMASYNHVREGDVFPAMVVKVWGPDAVNLQVWLDGTDTHWVTSVQQGDAAGRWFWPPRA